ncbi:MAG: ATP-binding cassette domain-containing protein [Candidatus Metalachnospira sp.]|nr:ATP-binding cassette domain-containing protein [Candidatus Metalachnospira sp.]
MSLVLHIRKKLNRYTLVSDFETDGQLALLGASGSGKSMTLKCIAGIEKPDEGIIILNGKTLFDSDKKVNVPPQKRNIGYLFQNYALFPNMTVRENITVAMKSKDKEKRLKEILSEFYIEDIENKYPYEISGGQQQRTALARIIASEPDAILLDEPFSALDNYIRWKLEMTVADTIKKFGGISVMVTHDRNEAYRNCSEICVIDEGKSEPVICTHELMSNPMTVGAARISGCKNIYEIEKTVKKDEIFVPKLNIYLKAAKNVGDNIKFVGLRAHYFTSEGSANKIECSVERVTEDVFSTIIMLKPVCAVDDFELIRIEKDKETAAELVKSGRIIVYIEPKDVLLLE